MSRTVKGLVYRRGRHWEGCLIDQDDSTYVVDIPVEGKKMKEVVEAGNGIAVDRKYNLLGWEKTEKRK